MLLGADDVMPTNTNRSDCSANFAFWTNSSLSTVDILRCVCFVLV